MAGEVIKHAPEIVQVAKQIAPLMAGGLFISNDANSVTFTSGTLDPKNNVFVRLFKLNRHVDWKDLPVGDVKHMIKEANKKLQDVVMYVTETKSRLHVPKYETLLKIKDQKGVILMNLLDLIKESKGNFRPSEIRMGDAIEYLYNNPEVVREASGRKASIFEYVLIAYRGEGTKSLMVVKPVIYHTDKHGKRTLQSLFSTENAGVKISEWVTFQDAAMTAASYCSKLFEHMSTEIRHRPNRIVEIQSKDLKVDTKEQKPDAKK